MCEVRKQIKLVELQGTIGDVEKKIEDAVNDGYKILQPIPLSVDMGTHAYPSAALVMIRRAPVVDEEDEQKQDEQV